MILSNHCQSLCAILKSNQRNIVFPVAFSTPTRHPSKRQICDGWTVWCCSLRVTMTQFWILWLSCGIFGHPPSSLQVCCEHYTWLIFSIIIVWRNMCFQKNSGNFCTVSKIELRQPWLQHVNVQSYKLLIPRSFMFLFCFVFSACPMLTEERKAVAWKELSL